ncbi:hypothetical protein OG271_04085 [Micromonospora rifamycinica]|uniref:hypothetical protein n=1 Tax=Micromonospora rifamycinica TaxID=291594 RepID=UPI002E2C9445|nr:hypothetical protein [Micromonospora rifamycinica]
MPPTLGSTVLYTLTEQDAANINQRRTDLTIIGLRVFAGIEAEPGQTFPATVTHVDGDAANVQVALDGTDVFWAPSRTEGEPGEQGHWVWPPTI